jgi:hypothetical protein
MLALTRGFLTCYALGAGRAVVFLVVLDACRDQLARDGSSFDGLEALEPDAKEAPRMYKILYSCSRKTTASDGPSGGHGPFAAAMCDVNVGFFAEGVALRDAIDSVSRAVQSSAGGQAPTVTGRPDALPSDFCINPRVVGPGKRKTREADEALLAVLRETGFEKKEVDWLADHGVHCVEDVESLREKDLANLGVRFRKLIEYVKSSRAQADAFVSTINALAKKSQVFAIIQGMVKYPRHQILQKRGCKALAGLVASKFETRVKVAAEGGIVAILGAMRGHAETEEVQAKGCGALLSLAYNADNKVKVAAEGGIGAILGAMRGHAESEEVQRAGCGALLSLAHNADNLVKVAAEGGIGAILGAMRGHPESEEVQRWGCGALRILAGNANNQVKVAAEGGIGAILGAMRGHAETEEVQANGCGALLSLAHNADNLVKVAAEGGIGAILGAMRGHPETEEVQWAGCGTLWFLAYNADNKVKVAAEGGIGGVILGAMRVAFGTTGPGAPRALLQSMKSAGAEDAVKRAIALKHATLSMKQTGQRLLDALKNI